ncbi:RB1-inducible coiled-coil protein 1 isoform X2 [Chrysoperla carnea]|uniref:RB1-inducible coiled-coil protein 1 isoform X2 n=1 Tax=Chrysoperla carnea TaxID=189513 RepID=UPI001D089E62|nr:RB1-inducible coiled-coil protein 1 isoform X2 [Chrysoperla carnea]
MLYVFHVDRGTLVTFDMQLSVAYVDKLKEEIERAFGIPVDKQVLMMSGGHCLENHARVCSFGTGTDTNPVYLFSKELAESPEPPKPLPDPTPDIDLKEQTEASSNLPASYNTVVARAQLAQKFHELSREQHRICERLVSDQHRQQQGWAAVAANLDDLVSEFRKRSDAFLRIHRSQLERIEGYRPHLQNFRTNLEILSKIPVIPALLKKSEAEHVPQVPMLTEVAHSDEEENQNSNEQNESGESSSSSSSEEESEEMRPISLLQWVSMKDSQFTLQQVAYDCNLLMEELSEKCIEQWIMEKDITLSYIENYPLKEISGLGDRLFGLEQLMCDAKRLVDEQADLAHSFLQNQNRASNLGDASILPDLCASHRRQLNVMLQNYNLLRDIRRRCNKAKEELCINLHRRLGWILTGERQLLECDYKLSTFTSKQKHLDYLLCVLDQIHKAPEMYLNAVIEVVRRRQFSQAFLTWASDLACHLTSIHSEELMRRTDFHAEFEEHFLNALFTGLTDMPPPYATEPPPLFDCNLPLLSMEDIDMVKEKIPEIAEKIKIPDFAAFTQFFQSKSLSGVKFEERGVGDDRCIEDRLVQAVADAGLGSVLDRGLLRPTDSQISGASSHLAHHHLKDFDRGFESETDTEEFEKVGQSPVELQFENKTTDNVSTTRTTTLDASTLTEDNLGTSKLEIQNLKDALHKACEFAKLATTALRTQMSAIKSDLDVEKQEFTSQCKDLLQAWERYQHEAALREREKIQRLTVDHELEMNDIKNLAIAKDDDIRTLKLEKISTECAYKKRVEEINEKYIDSDTKLKQALIQCEQFEKQIENLHYDHERALQQLREQMQREHQSEIESLRSRFRLMTVANMERSPSDTSLERIDRIDVIELINHESIIAQLKENLIQQQEDAVKKAIEEEQEKWSTKLDMLTVKFQDERHMIISDSIRKLREDKDKQIEALMLREEALSRECRKYKEVIQQLTDDDGLKNNPVESQQQETKSLLEKIDQLQQDRCRLEAELSKERSKRLIFSPMQTAGSMLFTNMAQSMGASVAVCPTNILTSAENRPQTCDASTSTENRVHRMLSSSQLALIQAYNININLCSVGDRVLVVWDKNFQNYVLLLDSSSIFVLNADCIPSLGLRPPTEATKKDKAVGEIIEKEFCYAKKTENRYHFPKGTRFYRVRVKPLSEEVIAAVRRDNSNPSGHSSMETSTTTMHTEATLTKSSIHQDNTQSLPIECIGSIKPHQQMSQSCTSQPIACSSKSSEKTPNPSSFVPSSPSSGGSGAAASSSPYLSRSLFGLSSSTSRNSSFSIYHSLSQPSSLVSCSGDNRPTEQITRVEDEIDSNIVIEHETSDQDEGIKR